MKKFWIIFGLLVAMPGTSWAVSTLLWQNDGTLTDGAYNDIYIERAADAESAFVPLTTLTDGTLETYDDTEGAIGQCYRLRGLIGSQFSAYSNIACRTGASSNVSFLQGGTLQGGSFP